MNLLFFCCRWVWATAQLQLYTQMRCWFFSAEKIEKRASYNSPLKTTLYQSQVFFAFHIATVSFSIDTGFLVRRRRLPVFLGCASRSVSSRVRFTETLSYSFKNCTLPV